MHPLTSSILLLTLLAAAPGQAQEVSMPADPVQSASTAAPVSTPQRGVSMAQVEAQYGAPSQRHAAIGNPPITRWDYPGFSVFFEYQHVVHSVVR